MIASSKPSNWMPTLEDVAKLAGVGRGTASRALMGQGYVSAEAAKRIHAAAEQLGYQRNELARNLKMKRSGAIGLVVPDIGGPFMVSCVRAIQKVLRLKDYNPIIAFTDGKDESEAEEIDYLIRHQIEGLIIVPAGGPGSYFASPQLARIPVVAFDQPVLNKDYDAVLVKNRHGAHMAVEHLIHHGHRRIACLGVNGHLYSIQKRIEGYCEAMKQANLPAMLGIAASDSAAIGRQLDEWLALKNPPTALFSLNEFTSVELMQAMSQRGIRMPHQLAFAGFDDIQLGPYLDPPLTAVLQPAAEIGEASAQRLLERIAASAPMPAKRMFLNPKLIIRGSCGCAPSAKL
jgi:LacI family transcriptional regulator